jgi:general secretion pathway protein F
MQFDVRALDANQRIVASTLEALDRDHANAQLQAQGLVPLSVKPRGAWGAGAGFARSGKKQFDLLLFAQELLALVTAGLGVVEALDTLLERTTQLTTKSVLHRVRDSVQQGRRLSLAFSEQPDFFPPLFVGMVQAAEGTSDLGGALERYVAYETRTRALQHKVISAAIYPGILLCVGSAVALFLLGYVVPRFSAVYQSSSRPLPWASQLLLAWGQFASKHAEVLALLTIGTVAALFFGFRWLKRSGTWMRLLAWLPGVHARVEVLVLTRLYLSLGMLLEGGIPLVKAMQLCEAVLSADAARKLRLARHDVGQGNSLSSALERHGLATKVAVRMVRVGEQTGQMGSMLRRTAAFYDTETTRWIEQFSKAFEPILMAAIGTVIGVIVILLYMPIFDLAGSI